MLVVLRNVNEINEIKLGYFYFNIDSFNYVRYCYLSVWVLLFLYVKLVYWQQVKPEFSLSTLNKWPVGKKTNRAFKTVKIKQTSILIINIYKCFKGVSRTRIL